ncbi:MAG: LysR substrate-binding domain-containing protein [Candidatus Binataceae bacterium]
MELRHLRDFVAVAEELSFTRGAHKLHLAQPSLTRQIKSLEEEIGVKLLERGKGRVSLTDEGRIFLEEAKRVLALSAQSVETMRRRAKETEQLRIGYLAGLHNHLLPVILATFGRKHPEVAVNLFDMTGAEQLEALEGGRIDLGFVGLRGSLPGRSLRGECVEYYDILVALPKRSRLSKKPKLGLRELKTQFFVTLSESKHPGWIEWMKRIFQQEGFVPRTLQEADTVWAILNFVAAGLGVALLPEQIKTIPHSGVVLRPLKQPIKVESWVAWKPENHSRSLARFIGIMKQKSSG